jgi:hypothetical protein
VNNPKFKSGDIVYSKVSEEIEQPMRIEGFDPWCKSVEKDGRNIYFYHVLGKHKKRGNELTVTLSESLLQFEPL